MNCLAIKCPPVSLSTEQLELALRCRWDSWSRSRSRIVRSRGQRRGLLTRTGLTPLATWTRRHRIPGLAGPAGLGGRKKRWDQLEHGCQVAGAEHSQFGIAVVGPHCDECAKTFFDRLEAQHDLELAG